ncbi:hypothetical protein GH714_025855 [Hevea brasiliensis]|uniref:Endoplasmic reticulum transmembrane protein n=1 Tax=Hevea brasiliensis TaxID=3981 RepID=A0A6A6KWP5_HEVBR|nr:hypothetical protein GH714_025855 [Hevea brasiliensis]
MGKGPATVKTIAGTMSVILLSSLMSIIKIQNKGAKLGTMSPRISIALYGQDCAFQFSLLGFTLFLGFIIDRMHHYLSKLIELRSSIGSSKEEVERLQKEKTELKGKEETASKEIKVLKEQISNLSENLKNLKSENEEKDKQIETAEAHVVSLQKQSADLLLEYDRLLEDNQNLQAQGLGYKS